MRTGLKRVLYLSIYNAGISPSQRFRIEQFIPALQAAGISIRQYSYFSNAVKGSNIKALPWYKMFWHLSWGYARMWRGVLMARRYQAVFIQRELCPLGPPLHEWAIHYILRKPFIYDFDDAIWLPNNEQKHLLGFLKCSWKTAWHITHARKVIAGNAYLLNYALALNAQSICIPTVLPVNHYKRTAAAAPTTLGWTGSYTTLPYLLALEPVLMALQQKYPIRILVICNRRPAFTHLAFEYRPWQAESEIQDIAEIDIGLMPQPDNAWTQGKCGFKLIQYMALGICPVAANSSLHRHILHQGAAGRLCSTAMQWQAVLQELIENPALRQSLGQNARARQQAMFSTQAHVNNVISVF